MKPWVFEGIQTLFRAAGFQIAFDRPVRNAPKLFALKAAELGVQTVLDIGANKGQFGKALRKEGYRGCLVSFEPLSSAHMTLCKAANGDAHWHVPSPMALGETDGVAQINVAKNLASSSFLPVRERSVRVAESSGYMGVETVAVRRLDGVLNSSWPPPFAIKLDTQGFELHVLRGGPQTLELTEVLVVEMSLVELYDGGPSFVDVYKFLESSGFRCASLTQGFADNERHELLQMDGVFVRDNARDRTASGYGSITS